MRWTWVLTIATAVSLQACLPARLDDATIAEKIGSAKSEVACLTIAACTATCKGDTACSEACSAGGTEATLKAHLALKDCTDACGTDYNKAGVAACADPRSDTCRRRCRTQACVPQLIACADDGTHGDKSCIVGSDCLTACGEKTIGDGLNCATECIQPLTASDKAALSTVTACYDGVDVSGVSGAAAKEQKILQACSGELAKCYTRGESGANACVQGMACMDPCAQASDTDACYTACAAKLTATAQGDFVSLLYCLGEGVAGTPQVISDCAWALGTCAAPKIGGLTCDQMQGTFSACTSKRSNALFACLGDTLAKGRLTETKPFLDFNVCVTASCGSQCAPGKLPSGCLACTKTKCAKESSACGPGK